MEAFGSMIYRSLPPTGNQIKTQLLAEQKDNLFPSLVSTWVDSGTSALALSLLDIKKKQDNVQNPEVIVPGYCCPDLLSAALYAGFKPVICDIQQNSPQYDLGCLSNVISDSTCAIICINFLGVPENIAAVRSLVGKRSISLIEDNAQWFPDYPNHYAPLGDYAIFSFGRGKALSLLGGGLVVSQEVLQQSNILPVKDFSIRSWRSKVALYHLLTKPYVYPLLSFVPGLNLGETAYHALEGIFRLSETKRNFVAPNALAYAARNRDAEAFYRTNLAYNQLAELLSSTSGRMLRFPYLFESGVVRDQVCTRLNAKGLGVSKLYQVALPKVSGVSELGLKMPDLPNAESFAARLITLPTHSGVTKRDAEAIASELLSYNE